MILPEDISAHFLSILQRVLCDDGEVGHKHKTGCKLVEPSPEYLHHDPLCGHNGCLHQGMPGFEKYIPKCISHFTRKVNMCGTMKRPFPSIGLLKPMTCIHMNSALIDGGCQVAVLLIAYWTVV